MRFPVRPLVLLLLFASGATGLVYELVWSKRLANLLGNSGQAHAIVLATFMGGLALGAWLFGRTADRVRRPLALYGLLELGVGLYALLFVPVLDVLGAGYLAVAPGLGESARVAARLALASASLLVPTVLMGGTVPALTRYFTEVLAAARRELALLYAVNSGGAALGVFLAGMALVPSFGLFATERGAACVNLALAAAALVAAALGPTRAPTPAAQRPAPEGDAGAGRAWPRAAVRAALLGVLLSGFTSMLYEVTWIRLLAIVTGGTAYSFTLILTAFILGIGLGSLWLARRGGDSDSLRVFAWLQAALVVSVCLALPFYGRLPWLFHHVHAALRRTEDTWVVYQALSFVFCCGVLLLPTFFMGASFPAAARVALGRAESLGRQLGGVYLWNTVGTVSGSLLAGLVFLPVLGLERNFLLGVALNLVAAVVAARAASDPAKGPGQHWPLAAAFGVALVWGLSSAGWAEHVSSSGRYREWRRTFDDFATFQAAVRGRSKVLFQQDDVFASVLVGETQSGMRYLRINGKIDGSNGDDIDTQVLAGHLGALLHPAQPKKVLLIGVGAGITAGSVLSHPIERLDVVEISPAVIEAARLFAADNRGALEDPRTRVHVDDAKTFLLLAREQYDLIISVPSNPWVSGVSGLFSKDFFEVAKAHLAPGGRLVQWIHTYESNREMVSLVVRTLRDAFPHGTTWVGPQDLVLVASADPQTVDVPTLEARLADPRVAQDLARVKVRGVATLLARQVHSDEGQLEVAGAGPVNTDDLNLLEYRSPRAYFMGASEPIRDERRPPDLGRRLAWSRFVAERGLGAEDAKGVYQSLAWVHSEDDALVRSAAEAWAERDPQSHEAALAVARSAWLQRDAATARALLDARVEQGARDPWLVAFWLELHRRRAMREHAPWNPQSVDAALRVAREVLAANPDHPELRTAVGRAAP